MTGRECLAANDWPGSTAGRPFGEALGKPADSDTATAAADGFRHVVARRLWPVVVTAN